MLVQAWISGSFFIFDYFYAQYLFSAITVLAMSRVLKGQDGNTDGEDFEVGIQFLDELKQNGNFGAIDFCRHTDALQLALHTFRAKTENNSQDIQAPVSLSSGTALPDETLDYNASLQEFLAQPDLDLSFMDMNSDELQGMPFPEIGGQSWSTA